MTPNGMQADHRKTVLIVEDSPTQALHLKTLLEDAGLDVYLAPNGRVGLTIAQRVQPHLVVLDVQMPEMDGLEVCRALKSMPETRLIPIVMLTARDDLETVMRSLHLGAIDYIPKDVHADAALLGALEQLDMVPKP
jgi:DNA-binding response OmpR family regulator